MADNKLTKDLDNRRFFLGPDEATKYYIAAPNAEVIRGADWTYSKMYTKCLVEGITTSAEMVDILTRRGIIGPEFEQRSTELTEILNEKITALDAATTLEDRRELAVEVATAREELFQWNQRLNGPMGNTCEQMADDARLEYLTAHMIENEDGTKVWESYDMYLSEKNQSLALSARFQIMVYLQGLEPDFLEKTPEAEALREVENEIINKAEEALKVAKALEEE
ncbi:MAG TPA: hypothetical protein EYP60_01560, partial [bacterium (Candidatus Stahlbacteria)]|nr:hypothetical protein [Candidatus Stahlbacteria bacterium]